MIHLKWIKSRKVRNIKNSLPLIIIKVDITYITSHNVYYVNSKVGEVMENEFNFESDIKKLRDAVDILEKMSPFVFDESILTAIYSSKANLKCLIYDLEDCVICD